MSKKQVHIISGDILPTTGYVHRKASEELKNDLSSLFSNDVDKYKKAINIMKLDPKDQIEEPREAMGPEMPSIKADWEKVSLPTRSSGPKLGDPNAFTDSKSIRPSATAGETSNGGRGHLRGALASIFNPTASEDVLNSEFTNHTLAAGEARRNAQQERVRGNRDWEEVNPAISTKDVPAAQMGFTPNRSAFKPAPLPEVKISEIEIIKKQNKQSAKAGIDAANIKVALDSIFNNKQDREKKDTRSWEDRMLSNLAENQTRSMDVKTNEFKIADTFVKPNPKLDNSLNGIFKMPPTPSEVEKMASQENIKRDSDYLKTKRQSRKEDRSWETASHAKGRKY